MPEALSLSQVEPKIDGIFQNFMPVLQGARAATSPPPGPIKQPGAQFPGYGQWLSTVATSIGNNSDPSTVPQFIASAGDARNEISLYFPATRDADLQQARLDPKYLFFYSDQLLGIFLGQLDPIRDAAGDYLNRNYSIPFTPNDPLGIVPEI